MICASLHCMPLYSHRRTAVLERSPAPPHPPAGVRPQTRTRKVPAHQPYRSTTAVTRTVAESPT